jgi:hypothetical protein
MAPALVALGVLRSERQHVGSSLANGVQDSPALGRKGLSELAGLGPPLLRSAGTGTQRISGDPTRGPVRANPIASLQRGHCGAPGES